MYIILSQRIDIESEYSDDLFQLYHYPARYKSQIHEGDIFIYYQGDRLVREHRYYFGTGKIGHIWTDDGENYYATIVDAASFSTKYQSISPRRLIMRALDSALSETVYSRHGKVLCDRFP